jgi:hypothetical protein
VGGLHERAPDEESDRRPWVVLMTIITVCFVIGIAFLVLAVWLDWE